MIRDPKQLHGGPFDILVIGGGIYGAWTAYDAALRGLRVALIDKSDWASGTSSASSKLIHGGLRYLEHFHFRLVKKSLDERNRLARLAPHRVTPLRFLVPVYRDSHVGLLRLRTGFWLYDRLAGRDGPVDRHEILGRDEVIERYPHLRREGLKGGVTYGDCQMDDAQFALEIIAGASAAGAVVVNYAEALRLLIHRGKVIGALVTDRVAGQTFDVRASVVVNTAGPWAPRIGADAGPLTRVRMTKGVHLVLPPLGGNDAMLVMTSRGRRVLFVIPWYGKTLLGTTDTDYDGDVDRVRVEDQDIDYLLREANAVLGDPAWDRSMVEGSFAGIRALKHDASKSPSSLTREWALERPLDRLLVSTGGKYTSARADAASIVDAASEMLDRPAAPKSPTESLPFPWCPRQRFAKWSHRACRTGEELGLDPETARWSVYRYGTAVGKIHERIKARPTLAARIHPELPFCRAEIVQCAAEGMALTLEDLLRRRTPVLILSPARRDVLEEAASLAAPVLGWNEERRGREVDEVMAEWNRGYAAQAT